MKPSISIITPSFNQGPFIERTIRSVLSQDAADVEYVVFDGGSTDETLDVLKSFGSAVRWVRESDRGQSDAINKGFQNTEAPIIGWLNSDDIYYPGALRAAVDYFHRHPETDVIYGRSNHIDEQDEVIEPYPTEPWSIERMLETCFISQPAAFFRRRVVERWGPLDVKLNYCMDYEFWLRLGIGGAKFVHVPELLAATRVHGAAKTFGARRQCHKEINDMMAATFGRVPDRWIFNYAHAAVGHRGITMTKPIRYSLLVYLRCHAASLRWNHRLSWGVEQLYHHWFRSAFPRICA